ncbi:coagulation factor XII-like [Ceratina calcarata]|uniref:Coagulation factor XII-like n=1 Tax=Ceratina calcarata TaxID=156304 RepID=A0AAJ7NAD6_9HYME|nr:coagulation factor XII-like [Ceratina calcarata]
MLVVSLILITTIFSTNGFPTSPEAEAAGTAFQNFEDQAATFQIPDQQNVIYQTPGQQDVLLQASGQQKDIFQRPEQQGVVFQVPEQQEGTFQIPEQQEGIFQVPEQQQGAFQIPEQQEGIFQVPEQQQDAFQIPEQQQAVFQTPAQQNEAVFQTGQKINQGEPSEDYFTSGGTNLAGQAADFTISCVGANKICTSTSDCINGFIDFAKSTIYPPSTQNQECRIQDQICCTIAKELQGTTQKSFTKYNPTGIVKQNVDQNPIDSSATFEIPTHVQLGCAAALLCVEEKFCTLDGTISSEPVTFSEKQLYRRVPLNSCRNTETGTIGKCCRDPNYVDPWPTGNLPANYTGGFDEQGFPTFLNIAKVRPPSKSPTKSAKKPVQYKPVQSYPTQTVQKPEPALVPQNSDVSMETLVPPSIVQDVHTDFDKANLRCGVRNKVTQQSEIREESKAVFGEIPWQAMVLHSKERKILCSGALIGTEDILTAANCVNGLSPSDVSIKLGEWKLGYELKHEEPLPFQIINITSIDVHPNYVQGYGEHDLAMLHLERPATMDLHISPLCLPEPNYFAKNKQCITTGWGKSILQAHYAGAIMHVVDMNVLPTEHCKERLLSGNFGADSVNGIICAEPKEEKDNVCETDVGGPLACRNEHGLYDLIGIYSQDTGCLPTNQVAVFAPLDQAWLKGTVSESVFQESKTNVKHDEQLLLNDYRNSTLDADNEYLPPVQKSFT